MNTLENTFFVTLVWNNVVPFSSGSRSACYGDYDATYTYASYALCAFNSYPNIYSLRSLCFSINAISTINASYVIYTFYASVASFTAFLSIT